MTKGTMFFLVSRSWIARRAVESTFGFILQREKALALWSESLSQSQFDWQCLQVLESQKDIYREYPLWPLSSAQVLLCLAAEV